LRSAIIGFVFTMQQDARQQRIEDQRAESALTIQQQNAQDEALQAYLDQMSQLMLDRKLLEAEQGDPLYTLAQARTSTVIARLDAEHNQIVTRFLTYSGLAGHATSEKSSMSLLRFIALQQADLSDAILRDAILTQAELEGADLSNAILAEADLSGAILTQAELEGADLSGANLSGAILSEATLSRANLRDAKLTWADLSGANLSEANLNYAVLRGAYKRNSDGSTWIVTNEELNEQAASLEGATMPNGQKYEDWLKSKGSGDNSGPS
jgi:uncharacterized protein YjbI with pentapeptide repeats